ncbi:hypothetical protein [Stigmatella erecta]|uniref:Nuclease-related domain-containing protein n=1 Tax=Stigmatella erecta TaxID=83460 RepID=A0A1I0I1Y3_9BACT|nr:hypothetical protein [Stigmatella erecta]SET89699.1 hypothetical protein SAMN05443639_105211 [Stigmatella erecta]
MNSLDRDNENLLRSSASADRPSLAAISDDLAALYAHYGLTPDSGGSRRRDFVTRHLYDRIRALLQRPEGLTSAEHHRLRAQAILRHVVDSMPLHPLFNVLEVIWDACGRLPRIAHLDEHEAWASAIAAARDYLELNPDIFSDDLDRVRMYDSRTFHVGEAALRLRQQGVQLEIANGRVLISREEGLKIANKLLSLIRQLGAVEFANALFQRLASHFNPQQMRYAIIRQVSLLNAAPPPQIPYGYLLNLCVRQVQAPPFSSIRQHDADALFRETLQLSTDLVATYDVQPYNTFEGMFQDGASILSSLQTMAIYDSTFTLTQLRPSDVTALLRGVFSWADDAQCRVRCGWSLKNAFVVIHTLVGWFSQHRGPHAFRIEQVVRAHPWIPQKEIEAILHMLAHPIGGANTGYALPTDVEQLDFGFKPLLRMRNGQLLLLDISWCSPAFYEAIAVALRKAGIKNVQENIGKAAEVLVHQLFSEHGVPTHTGKYVSRGEHGECDVVVETPSHVILLELKGKVLTRNARAGGQVSLWGDMADSLLKAQTQIGGHEVRLRREGFLDLKSDDGAVYRLNLAGREVERITLTLVDFGALHDRYFIQQYLHILLGNQFTSEDPAVREKLKGFRESSQKLREQYEALASLGASQGHNPFMNCWFMSIPQLFVLLDGVQTPDEFKKALWTTRHATTRSLDFYFEHAHMLALRRERAGQATS